MPGHMSGRVLDRSVAGVDAEESVGETATRDGVDEETPGTREGGDGDDGPEVTEDDAHSDGYERDSDRPAHDPVGPSDVSLHICDRAWNGFSFCGEITDFPLAVGTHCVLTTVPNYVRQAAGTAGFRHHHGGASPLSNGDSSAPPVVAGRRPGMSGTLRPACDGTACRV